MINRSVLKIQPRPHSLFIYGRSHASKNWFTLVKHFAFPIYSHAGDILTLHIFSPFGYFTLLLSDWGDYTKKQWDATAAGVGGHHGNSGSVESKGLRIQGISWNVVT